MGFEPLAQICEGCRRVGENMTPNRDTTRSAACRSGHTVASASSKLIGRSRGARRGRGRASAPTRRELRPRRRDPRARRIDRRRAATAADVDRRSPGFAFAAAIRRSKPGEAPDPDLLMVGPFLTGVRVPIFGLRALSAWICAADMAPLRCDADVAQYQDFNGGQWPRITELATPASSGIARIRPPRQAR